VFNQPTEPFYKLLLEHNPSAMPPKVTKYSEFYGQFDEQSELKKVLEAQKKVRKEIQTVREKYDRLEGESKVLVDDISKLEIETQDSSSTFTPQVEELIPAEDAMDNVEWVSY